MNILKEIFKKLSVIEGFYDYIRIVDPINKLVFDSDSLEYANIPCYKHFENESPCKNCVCSNALTNNNLFAKLENKGKEVLLILSCPINIDDSIYIVEIFKSLNRDMSNKLPNFKSIVDKLNDTTVNGVFGNNNSL